MSGFALAKISSLTDLVQSFRHKDLTLISIKELDKKLLGKTRGYLLLLKVYYLKKNKKKMTPKMLYPTKNKCT